jgi:hypothetical protein
MKLISFFQKIQNILGHYEREELYSKQVSGDEELEAEYSR